MTGLEIPLLAAAAGTAGTAAAGTAAAAAAAGTAAAGTAAAGTAAATGITMAQVALATSLAGAGVGLFGSLRQAGALKASGRAARAEAQYRAEQGRVAAGQEKARSQRIAQEEARQGRLRMSAIQAKAAGQGQAGSESTLKMLGDMDYETQYRKSLALFEGDKSAQSLGQGSLLAEYDGARSMAAANTKASAARLRGVTDFATSVGGTLYNKYSPKGFEDMGGGYNPSLYATPRKPVRF